jgi:rod shape-determining protein MreC
MVDTRGGRRFAVFFLTAAFLIFLLGRWLEPVHHVAAGVAAPFEAVINGVATRVGDGISGMFQGEQYRRQYEDLLKKYGLVLNQNASDQQKIHDYAILNRIVNFEKSAPQFSYVTSRVIGGPVNSLSPYIRLNKGSSDGLKVGMTVLSDAGFFIGTISDVWSNGCDVELMISPSSTVGAKDISTQAKGVVDGKFNSIPVLNDVATSGSLRQGDFVVTSGDWNLYPRDIQIGRIIRVHRVLTSPLQSADVEPLANFGDLEIVQVIRNFVPSLPPTK